ncbi:hypothetical protein AN6860.2 [Aspergillus nidulans FGSC A4]|uniref:Uncharacterized protein n=1 Tax=Emericella nidulans (strain FGSC A4 / ATCC 38163 / CBS 112.46 / NRRL 194 / M139) TaxID=227321 RepID=Q5AXX0_EMENI|nr:hypothetical protein [Aspergillus nidulans FGSC A4]EAA58259.1 hypothetical protein AN6860.2 [Aspergillus nidulans FGSC A4]CBF71611.1 TPA: hypothetical protein ANIA_06860 [Aspergillus nidulans FGSC A4]|eukprot:XP_664464.1 hypothetical protein AN6860.2 [Aspergillus nidulans FGSC A4]
MHSRCYYHGFDVENSVDGSSGLSIKERINHQI